MNFDLGDDRRMLADLLWRFVEERYGIDERNRAAYGYVGYDPEKWRELADLGVLLALFDEDAGGFGGSGFDIMVVFEALGRGLVVEPFLGALMVGQALAAAGNRKDALAGIMSGEMIAAFAHEEANGEVTTRAVATANGWRIDGAKGAVIQAEAASLFLVSVTVDEDEEPSLFLLPAGTAGLAIHGYRLVDGGRAGDVSLTAVEVGPDALVGRAGKAGVLIERALGVGLLALSAEALGAMIAAKDMTVEYLRTRQQFGVPIGKFQALQHRMAALLIEIEQARSAVINAAAAIAESPQARERALSAAKYTVGRTGTLVSEEAIQLHGGIGMTWELPLSHYAKRLTMIDHQLGDEDYHLQRYLSL
jgi:alkylation response protein AidB-like acyl-CoA dehydrogenase